MFNDMFSGWDSFVLRNFGLVMFLLAILLTILDWPIQKIRRKASFYEILYRWVALLPVGVTAIYAFGAHAFFPEVAARTIGWAMSPFQFEVAVANLGLGLIAIMSFKSTYTFRLATVIANTCWFWGDALGHLYQMFISHNFSVGNAGSWFWMDVLVPFLLIICIVHLKPKEYYL